MPHLNAHNTQPASARRPEGPRSRAAAVVSRSAFQQRASSARAAARISRVPRLQLLKSLTSLVEIKAWTQKYETAAGRSAMLGTTTAILVETLTQDSLLGEGLPQEVFALLAFGTVAAAAVCAALTTYASQASVPALLEPVITSLTAVNGSASSVTPATRNVDVVVDEVLKSTFTAERLRQLTDYTDGPL